MLSKKFGVSSTLKPGPLRKRLPETSPEGMISIDEILFGTSTESPVLIKKSTIPPRNAKATKMMNNSTPFRTTRKTSILLKSTPTPCQKTSTPTSTVRPYPIFCPPNTPNGTWSEWSLSEPCTSDCGSCGRKTRIRTCMSFDLSTGTGCPCVGSYKITEPCNIGVCQYPRPSCCPPFNLIYLNGYFACGPQEKSIIAEFISNVLD